MLIPRESEYVLWIKSADRWSPRAQSDLLSRLRRANAIAALDHADSFSGYRSLLTSKFDWGLIPSTSQSSVLQAAKIYLDWASSTIS